MAAWGLTKDDFGEADIFGVWPDNWAAVSVFILMGTQWRVGPAGPYGLDYSALPAVLRLAQVPRSQWTELFEDMRVLEDAALEELRKH